MRWKGRRQSRNVDDRRYRRGPVRGGPKIALGGGVGTLILVVVVLLLGGNPMALLQSGSGGGLPMGGPGPGSGSAVTPDPRDDQHAAFVSTVLADTEDVWNRLLAAQGIDYQEPTMVLFRDRVQSACGFASSASGPFYCPADEHVYLDLSFFDQLAQRFDAPGDFAQAYVVAHEVGHHVQHLLGITDRVHGMKGRVSEEEYNALSVRLELQADFFAGVWAHHAERANAMLEPGDIEEALRAASAIGDDTIQRRTQGYIVPESFTHGTSEQRLRWFRHGFETGDLAKGDTFSLPDP